MTNQEAYGQAYQNGYAKGYEAGKKADVEQAFKDGYDAGFKAGKKAGANQNTISYPTLVTVLKEAGRSCVNCVDGGIDLPHCADCKPGNGFACFRKKV